MQTLKDLSRLLVDCLCVCGPLQFIVQHHTQVFVRVHNVDVCPSDADWRGQGLVPPEVHHHLFRLHHIQLQLVLLTPFDKIANQVPVLILPPALYTPVSPENFCR